jgi:hypothetical protein
MQTQHQPHDPSTISLSAEWSRCADWIAAALEHANGTHSMRDVFEMVERSDAQFWPLHDAAIVTEIVEYPQCRTLRFWLAGGNLKTLFEAEPTLINWSKSWGCKSVEIVGRRGWHRALNGYRPTATIMTKEIDYE